MESNFVWTIPPSAVSSYTVAGIGIRLCLCANALRCKACQVQPQEFQTGFSIVGGRCYSVIVLYAPDVQSANKFPDKNLI